MYIFYHAQKKKLSYREFMYTFLIYPMFAVYLKTKTKINQILPEVLLYVYTRICANMIVQMQTINIGILV